jgi:hypothetical protein
LVDVEKRIPTSVILEGIVRDAPPEGATFAWLVGSLQERSFGIVVLIVALVGLVPGASTFVGLLLAVPAIQMISGRMQPVLPRRVAARRVSSDRLARLLGRVIPAMRRMERVVRPRWPIPFETTKRVVGVVILLLGGTMLAPIPFSHVIPVLTIMLIAFAFLEEDGALLTIALGAAAVSLAITTAIVWGALEAGRLL